MKNQNPKPTPTLARLGIIMVLALSLLGAKPATAPPADWPRLFRLGYVPVAGSDEPNDPFPLVGKYLSRELKIEVKMTPLENYLAVINGLRRRTLEGALLGPNAYVEAAEFGNLQPLVMELYYPGKRGYQSVLITRNGSDVRRLEDARGKVLAFTEPDSASGFLIPMLHFVRDLEVAPAGFASKVVFAGGHGAVAQGVFKNTYAVGATNEVDLARAVEELHLRMEDFRVLWTSPMIPGSPYCVRRDLPESLKSALSRALLNLKDAAVLKRLKIVGLAPVEDSEYNLIRELRKIHP